MDNESRRKVYKQIWFKKQQAKKHGNMLDYQKYELELDDFRKYKKHDPKYDLDKKVRKEKRYKNYLKTGFFTRYSKKWRKDNPAKYKSLVKQQWLKTKSDPKVWDKYRQYERKYHRKYYARNAGYMENEGKLNHVDKRKKNKNEE